ncbi:MAG: hypothetical protein KAS32_03210 [Candidatus Peribacteraceae bacterium]|nr:hypothetical protein [Candidatus Peribacteraceae bacterium]
MDLAQVVEMINSLGVNAKDAFVIYVVAKFGLTFIIRLCLIVLLAFTLKIGVRAVIEYTHAISFFREMYRLTNADGYKTIESRQYGPILHSEVSRVTRTIMEWKGKADG